ncbi:GmrSD restriction endonucleases N-terminal domain-containing protein [Frankia sp. AiPs1]|uniref:DUF262 domain-containing protein n=1 Tax=Frankia sp. AiPa1 TaxID=573492 RepID=UPI00202ACB56|nr:DUF262 domain-containing protein [Frankia sp. AiPa1]MCL9762637.1 DUF262 domain-containing protein [Frankia sp. AiPa1]
MALDGLRLGDLLRSVQAGKIQLPDFQRPWKWDDDRIRSLLATVTLDYPLGVIMTLETGGEARFKARPLAGTAPAADLAPEQLLLDGQQRLTSLYQALLSPDPVQTEDARHNKFSRWYYIDIAKAVDESTDREDAILSVPEDRLLRTDFARRVAVDLTSRQKECEAGLFPLNLTLDRREVGAWQRIYVQSDGSRWDIWPLFQSQVLERTANFIVPQIRLPKETHKEAVCAVFEKVNTGGVVLTVFELLTATYAGDQEYSAAHGADFSLADDWARTLAALSARYPVLEGLENTDFLQALSLVVTYHRRHRYTADRPGTSTAPAIGCKRKDLLDLPLQDYLTSAPAVAEALEWAGAFLNDQCVFRREDLPYRTQLVPLAAIRVILGARADGADARAKIARWYWCGVLGELYSGTIESRFPRDLEQVVRWIDDGDEPDTVTEANFQEQRLRTLATRNSAAYKGIFALLLKQGCYDWYRTGEPINADILLGESVEFHLVFPKGWFERFHRRDSRMSSVVNKTPLSFRANRTIGTRSPATYLEMFARESGALTDWVDDLVSTHRIDPKTLRAADFDAFYRDRTNQLLTLVERAMGKRAAREILSADARQSDDPA